MASALSALLNALSVSGSTADHEEILKNCNEALRENRIDANAQHVRAVALLKLDRYDDALRQFESGGDALKKQAQLEYAYTLYKVGNLEAAREEAEKIDSRAGKHLQAQSSYRLEDFETAAKLLKELQVDTIPEGEENDLNINTLATETQFEWRRLEHLTSRRKPSREDFEGFETAFNFACVSIARGELPQAEMLLDRAKSVCLALDLPDEDKKDDLLLVTVQQLFVSILLGKKEKAENFAGELVIDPLPKSSSMQIAQMNRMISNHSTFNPFLASRILKARPQLASTDRLFQYQTDLFQQNQVALEFLSGKFAGIEKSTSKQIQAQTTSTVSREQNAASSANAAAHAQLEIGKPGIKSMKPLLERRPFDLGLVATLVQLYVSTKNHGSAIKLVEDLCQRLGPGGASEDLDVRYAPGLVAIIVSLYSVEGRKAGTKDELAKAAAHWERSSELHAGLLKAGGLALLRSGTSQDIAEAEKLFDRLARELPNDKFASTGYIASRTTPASASSKQKSASLRPIEKLTQGIDVDALEAEGVPQPVSTATILSRKRAADAAKPAKKRIRKSVREKNYDPNAKVDPERWLPMRDRSYYKPKNKKKKGGKNAAQGSSQGIAVADEAPAATAQTSVISGGGGGGGGSSSKKKKKNKK